MDSSSYGIIGHHGKLFQCSHKQKGSPQCIAHYINHHCCLQDMMHNAKPYPLCKHWKQFSACDMPFDWQNMVSRYNWPMAQTTACPSHPPTNDHLLWSEKMRFSNPCKYMLMGFQNLIFRFVYSSLSSCAPENLSNSNKIFCRYRQKKSWCGVICLKSNFVYWSDKLFTP